MDLRHDDVGEGGEAGATVESVTRPRHDATGLGLTIFCINAGDPIGGLVEQRSGRSETTLIERPLSAFAGIDDDGDVIDGHARLRDVRGQDDFAMARRRSIVGLLQRRGLKLGVETNDGALVVGLEVDDGRSGVERVAGLNDLVVAGKEDEDGARSFVLIEDEFDERDEEVDVHGFVVETGVIHAQALFDLLIAAVGAEERVAGDWS